MKLIKELDYRAKGGHKLGLYECPYCSNIFEARICQVNRNIIKSCKCLMRSVARKSFTTHGMSTKKEYRIWNQMKQRCNNVNDTKYSDYGNRGIIVCERWNKFENFYEDMGPRPSKEYSIHRKDNDGNYEPENCIWTTSDVQQSNKRNIVNITINNVTKSLIEWCKEFNINKDVVYSRIFKYNWEPYKAITTQPRSRRR